MIHLSRNLYAERSERTILQVIASIGMLLAVAVCFTPVDTTGPAPALSYVFILVCGPIFFVCYLFLFLLRKWAYVAVGLIHLVVLFYGGLGANAIAFYYLISLAFFGYCFFKLDLRLDG